MFKNSRPPRKYHRFLWLLGFLGFAGFRYFFSHDFADIFYFSFFGHFSTWFTARLAAEMPDERYKENRLKAKAAAMFVPAGFLFVIGLGLALEILSRELVVLTAAAGWTAAFVTYAAAFRYYERH